MPTYRTPGVYVNEIDKFPNQIAQVETAIPIFIGYTETASAKGESLTNRAYKVSSFTQFEQCFGSFPVIQFDWTNSTDTDAIELNIASQVYYLKQTSPAFHLYKSVKLFFHNGGSECYIVSVGDYLQPIQSNKLISGIKSLVKEPTPAMLAIPESVSLPTTECAAVQNAQIEYCRTAQTLVAILDTQEQHTVADTAQSFRQHLHSENHSSFSAAYMPYLNSIAIPNNGFGLSNFANSARQQLADLLMASTTTMNAELKEIIKAVASPERSRYKDADINKVLMSYNSAYRYLVGVLKETVNIVPPSGAVIGAIAQTDINRGVWKAPANVSLSGVVSPTTMISEQQQETLNVDVNGVSINAIRTFVGSGTLIWGARTLDGNNLETQYINIRRALIMIEQSIKGAITAFVFEPNDANTWNSIRSMVENYLTQLWRQGALCGAKAEHAYAIRIGLGETMSADDIDQGRLYLSILLAMVRPAEFIEIGIGLQMQKQTN